MHPNNFINCRGSLVSLEQPLIMGILNLTPDSFFDGGKHNETSSALSQAKKLLDEGAHILDIGAASSKPGSPLISAEEEINRLKGPLLEIRTALPDAILSVDTYNSETAKFFLEAGGQIINDISAGEIDPRIMDVAANHHAPYIMMHMQGRPETMQKSPEYHNVTTDVIEYFRARISLARKAGIKDIIIDPGFGFGKSVAHNFQMLKELESFQILNLPILAGVSRKSMINKTLNVNPQEALNGTTVLNTVALINGAKILRVHDVKEAVEVKMLIQKMG